MNIVRFIPRFKSRTKLPASSLNALIDEANRSKINVGGDLGILSTATGNLVYPTALKPMVVKIVGNLGDGQYAWIEMQRNRTSNSWTEMANRGNGSTTPLVEAMGKDDVANGTRVLATFAQDSDEWIFEKGNCS